MQHKGVVKFFAVLFALVCLFQLSFTIVTSRVESKAKDYAFGPKSHQLATQMAKGDDFRELMLFDSISKSRERYFFDSVANETAFNLLVRKYTYKEAKEREINLGLDLKGGMNVTMEVSVSDIIRALSGYNQDSTFNNAVKLAKEKQKNSNADFVTLFAESFKELDPQASLAAIFNTVELKDRIKFNSTNEDVISIIRLEAEGAIDRTFNILRTRIDRFGVAQPNIQKLQTTGRILIELPGIKDPERVRKLLQGSARLEFWETYKFPEIYQFFSQANEKLAEAAKTGLIEGDSLSKDITSTDSDTIGASKDTSLLSKLSDAEKLEGKTGDDKSFEKYSKENPLFAYLNPAFVQNESGQYVPFESARVGSAFIKDTARINNMLARTASIFPPSLRLMWTVKPEVGRKDILELVAIKIKTRDGTAPLSGDVIVDARQDVNPTGGGVEVSMSMNAEGAKTWKNLTGDNIGRQIAIVLDGYIYSYPNVQSEISGGRSSISGGSMTIEEAQDLANILKAGKLPAPARIVQEDIVGPSLGREAIAAGLNSFVAAFLMVLLYMFFYYNRGGLVADLALVINIFFLFGVLASFGAVLTLPGIAGVVLTMGMAVDANVIIYERILEEIRAGKGLRLAIDDGYKNAYSAIIDGNVTTLLTGIVLYIFGSGPIQGFATTLIIGILSSLFTAILISRIIFGWLLDNNKTLAFDNKITRGFLANTKFDFISMRKYSYIFSIAIFVLGMASFAIRGLNYGVDFTGGRSYVVRFDNNISVNDVRKSLTAEFGETPEVKTFGPNSQVKITTKYMIENEGAEVDSIITHKLFNGLKALYTSKDLKYTDFSSDSNTDDKMIGILTSQKVGPTIAYDIKRNAILAIVFALLIIFVYIAIRFKKWQYGMAGLVALFHDTIITIGWFSLFYNVLPFNLEIDQAFIAAVLTIIGYSINDTVIIFDRIREYNFLYPKRDLKVNINAAVNSTLARTLNTAGTTLLVLLVIFIFGGEILRGFVFALFMGILIGTYSSVFNASPVAFDLLQWQKRKKEEKANAKK
ncbi:MAG: protein translocase subunit SecDF [Bacteroidales bacterium]|jgi:SecD/SecF fusion protein|nr:protein translocase subunit SecDF [Bacteroidales bacterium]